MDWLSWLSKTGLEPTLVYEYALAFTQNELDEDDLPYFNHEFLQSMGISIAKHRLEILKLARKGKGSSPHPMSAIMIAIKRTKRRFSKYLRTWIHREESALALVPMRSYSGRWKNAMVKRNKRMMMVNKNSRAPFLLTNGSSTPMVFDGSRINSFSSPLVNDHQIGRDDDDDDEDDRKVDGDNCDECWSSAVEEIRWDTMFQNLKPT